jgi:hypothetical protein
LLLLRAICGRRGKRPSSCAGAEKRVAVAIKEAGTFQVAALLSTCASLNLFQDICGAPNAAIATTSELTQLTARRCASGGVYSTPYPIEDRRWDSPGLRPGGTPRYFPWNPSIRHPFT